MSTSHQSLDLESESLVASLILQDLQEIQDRQKGKSRADAPIADDQLALQDQLAAIMSHMTLLEDVRVAQSLDDALRLDGDYLQNFSIIDQAEIEDHNAALALQRGEALPPPSASQRYLGDASVIASLNTTTHSSQASTSDSSFSNRDEVDSPVGLVEVSSESSTPIRRACVICTDRINPMRSFRAPCGHDYCRGCLVDLAQASTRDESLFPLRCCRRNYFDLDDVAPFLPPRLLTLVREKAVEFGTPSGNRVYCTNSTCSTFLGPSSDFQAEIMCPQCSTMVCSSCKNTAHPNEPCAENEAVLQVRALALEEHWQTCPSCNAIVELSQGCFHITCRCRASFCYLCAVPWKNCSCRQWDEDRIEYAAEQRVVNQYGERAMHAQPAVFAERVQAGIAELRVNHDCNEHVWRYRHGEGYCNECQFHLPIFMMRCTRCQILACKRCAQNRL